jgi:exodeoxyribonuclease VII large subunit
MNKEPYSVSGYIELLNVHISELYAEVIGEVCELKVPASGHVYPVLKDKETGHILPCTIWRTDYALSGVPLEVGMEVLVRGKPSFYGPFGKLSFNAKSVEVVGEGALKKAYEKMRKKLTEEGLFAAEKKRPLPEFPRRIGVVTSVHGAVIHDFSNNLRKSGFKISILNSKVEGPESGRDLTFAVRTFKTKNIDVLVIMRGGGSMQSLAGFDNEALVREIAAFPVPVIAGVGHHQDVTLAALAADAAESTPSFVAALLNKSWEEAAHKLQRSEERTFHEYRAVLENAKKGLSSLFSRIEDGLAGIFMQYETAKRAVNGAATRIDLYIARAHDVIEQGAGTIFKEFSQAIETTVSEYFVALPSRVHASYLASVRSLSERLVSFARVIAANSPERQLNLGYSIVTMGGNIVRSVGQVRRGQELEVKVADGSIVSEVKDIT